MGEICKDVVDTCTRIEGAKYASCNSKCGDLRSKSDDPHDVDNEAK
jgi:hypothetical protein